MKDDYYPKPPDFEHLLSRADRAESALKDAELEASRGGGMASLLIFALILSGIVAFSAAMFVPSITKELPAGTNELGGVAFVLLIAALGFYLRDLDTRRRASRMVYFAMHDLKRARVKVIDLKSDAT